MALLTADDVLNKKFQATKFREGYDQDEVDDFLDEVVTTLRAVQTENDGLKEKLAAAERRVAELARAGAQASDAVVEPAGEQDGEQPAAARPAEPAAEIASAAAPTPATARASEPESATGMLLLAQKLHDDYVRSGQEESERLVTDARTQGERIVREAEETSQRTLSQLEQERSLLERKIDELRVFERDYRARLKGYLENLLGDLDSRGSALPQGARQDADGGSGDL